MDKIVFTILVLFSYFAEAAYIDRVTVINPVSNPVNVRLIDGPAIDLLQSTASATITTMQNRMDNTIQVMTIAECKALAQQIINELASME